MFSRNKMIRLFHVSEDDSITRFEPRQPPSTDAGVAQPSVWAVDERHVPNYLLPRDCPRVTYYSLPTSKLVDIQNLIGPSVANHVVAIEAVWFERAYNNKIWIYEFNSDSFSLVDIGAGYYTSKAAVVPSGKREIENPVSELVSLGIELRVVTSLWPLRDAVIESSLQFSCIRMRNAQPRCRRENKTLHPTAYSLGDPPVVFGGNRERAAVEL